MAYQYRITFSEQEYFALKSIIENGWDDGSFEGIAGEDPLVQNSAMNKFSHAQRQPTARPAPKRKYVKKPKTAADVAMMLASGTKQR